MTSEQDTSSTRPYFIRALHQWCCDNGLTPYVAVRVDDSVQVPREFVRNEEIVLNISPDATSALSLGNEFIEFKARFGGVAREVIVPISMVMAIYARENGQGMAFPLNEPGKSPAKPPVLSPVGSAGLTKLSLTEVQNEEQDNDHSPEPPKSGGSNARPSLKRVK